jgi:hypothetical protein
MLPQHITLEEVKKACLERYSDGLLIAQSESPAEYGYSHKCGDGVVRFCAIGAALSKEALDKIEELGVGTIVVGTLNVEATNLLSQCFTYNKEEGIFLEIIQRAHDNWFDKDNTFMKRSPEEKFLKLIK